MKLNNPKLDNGFLFLSHDPRLTLHCSLTLYRLDPPTMSLVPDYFYNTTIMMLQYLQEWLSHKLDALGFISLLGAKEMDVATGSLIANEFTDRLPLLPAMLFQTPASWSQCLALPSTT